MAFRVFDEPQAGACFALSLVFSPICIAATALRFLATRRAGRKIAWDDWHALAGLVFFLAYTGYVFWVVSIVNGQQVKDFRKQQPELNKYAQNVGNVMNGLYGVQQTFVKFSLLTLYYRLFWVNRAFAISVWVVAVVQGLWGAMVLLGHLLGCNPPAKVWDMAGIPGQCLHLDSYFTSYETINSFLDFVVAGLAIWMLPSLHMKRSTRWHLGFLFLLGAFSGFIGIIKIVESQQSAGNNFLSVLWNVVQMATSIICCCAPIYKSIMPETGLYSKLYSWASRSLTVGSKATSTGSSGTGGSMPAEHSLSPMHSTHHKGQARKTGPRAHWVSLDDSSARALAWTEIEAGGQQNRSSHEDDEPYRGGIPMRTVKVDQSVDIV